MQPRLIARVSDGVQPRTTELRCKILTHTIICISLRHLVVILTRSSLSTSFQQTDAGCEQLHHLHQKQRSLSNVRCHQVGNTQTLTLTFKRPTQLCGKYVIIKHNLVPAPLWSFPVINMKYFSLRGNLISTMTSDDIRKCTYHPETNPYCPIFRVTDVLNYTNQNVADLALKVISVLHLLPFPSSPQIPSTRHRWRPTCWSCAVNYTQRHSCVEMDGSR